MKVSVSDQKLHIEQEGKTKKFVNQVEHVTFGGKYSAEQDQYVRYVTERCVFALTKEGMELIEIAPGIDLEKDILALMDFNPIIKKPRLMDERIFNPEPMGLEGNFQDMPLEDRTSRTLNNPAPCLDTEDKFSFIPCEDSPFPLS